MSAKRWARGCWKEPILIIYDGPENSGKTTVKRAVNELIDHHSLSFERWTGTQYAYGMLHGRDVELRQLLSMDRRMDRTFDCVLVFLTAPPEHLLDRVNTDPIEGRKYCLDHRQIEYLLSKFESWFEVTPFRVKRRIDTSKKTVKETASEIAGVCRIWRPDLEINW